MIAFRFPLAVAVALAVFVTVGPARGSQDDGAPAPPPAIGPYTPPLPGGPQAAPGQPLGAPLTEDALRRVLDELIRQTALANRLCPAPSAQGAPLQAATAPVTAPATIVLAASPATPVQVLMPPGPLSRGLAALGERMTRLGQPRLRTLQLAPAAYATVPVPTGAVMAPALPPLPSGQK